jgi:hypothetical protein
MRASKPKIPMWQKQKTGPATSMKRLSTELEIDRNAGIELVHNAKSNFFFDCSYLTVVKRTSRPIPSCGKTIQTQTVCRVGS